MSAFPGFDNPGESVSLPKGFHTEAGSRFAFGTADGRNREPFPLPLVSSETDGRLPCSKQSRSRLARRLALNGRVSDVAWGLNQLASGRPRRGGHLHSPGVVVPDIASAPGSAQRSALLSIRQHVLDDPIPNFLPAPKSAFRELMRSAEGDMIPEGEVRSLGSSRVGLPCLRAQGNLGCCWIFFRRSGVKSFGLS